MAVTTRGPLQPAASLPAEPIAAEHKHLLWPTRLNDIGRDRPCASWASLPTRFARLIDHATKDGQAERWDMTQIQFELERLRDAELDPEKVNHLDLIAEELLARAAIGDHYQWDEDQVVARVHLASGADVAVGANEKLGRVEVHVTWQSTGEADWKRVNKWLDVAADRVAAALRQHKWLVSGTDKSAQRLQTQASLTLGEAAKGLSDAATGLAAAAECLRFQ